MANPLTQAFKSIGNWSPFGRKSAPLISNDLLDPSSYQQGSINGDGAWFWGPNNIEKFFSFSGHKSAIKAYQKCPPVSAVINRKAQCFTNGKVYVLDSDGKEATSDISKRLRKLFTRPNPLQTWKQFDAQGYIYQQIFGYCPVLAIKPSGFKENYYAKSLWNIPPSMVKITEAKSIFYETTTGGMIDSIKLKYKDQETMLNVEDVLILRDFTPSFQTLLLPESRLQALEMPVNNIIGAYESRNVLINYRGALGILSPEKDQYGVAPINDDHKKELQQDFLRYGLKSEQWKFIISSAALKWQQMGIPTKDLMLLEEVVESAKAICDGFGHPAQLLGMIDPKYDNWDAAERGLYNNAVIPESDSNFEQWNDFFNTTEFKLILEKDFSHISILQADQVKEATARLTLNQAKKIEWDNNLITLNQWLEALGDSPIGPAGDQRIGEITKTDGPLAVAIGVGGVQGLIAVITAAGMSPEAKQATIEILFGIQQADAARMVAAAAPITPTP